MRARESFGRKERVTWRVHYSDRGTQYLSIRYTERLADAGFELSVGSRGDAFDNTLADTVIGAVQDGDDSATRAVAKS